MNRARCPGVKPIVFVVLFVLVLSFWPEAAEAVIQHDNSTTQTGASVTSLTWSHTVANQSNRVLIVGVQSEHTSNVQPTSVTYNGTGLTQINTAAATSSGLYQNVSLWYLLSPTVTTANVVVTWSATVNTATAGAISLYGVAQSAPEANATSYNNAGATTTNITTLTNDAWVVDIFGSGQDRGDLAPGSGQTQRFINASGATTSGGGSTKPVTTAGSTSVTWSQTGINRSAQVAASFAPSAESSNGISVDSFSTAKGVSQSTSLTWLHTVSGKSRLLIVGVSLRKNDKTYVSGVTYGGTALTQLGSQAGGGADMEAQIWYLKAPATGTANIVVSLSNTVTLVAAGISFVGVHQTNTFGTPAGAQATDTSPSVTVSSAANEVVIDVLAAAGDAGTPTEGSGQTAQWNDATGAAAADVVGAGSTEAGASSVPMSWTLPNSKKWAVYAVPIKPTTISGTVYTDEGSTNIGSGKTVRLLVSGASAGSATTNSSGNYTVAGSIRSRGRGTRLHRRRCNVQRDYRNGRHRTEFHRPEHLCRPRDHASR